MCYMKRMLSFLLTFALLALASTTLAQTQLWRCQYCGNTASSISELMARKCPKGPYGKCLAVYNGKATNNNTTNSSSNTTRNNNTTNKTTSGPTRSSATSNYGVSSSYTSPIKGDTITINGKKYILSSLEWAIRNDFWGYVYGLTKSARKHSSEIRAAVDEVWIGLKSGRFTYNGTYFTDHSGEMHNATKKKEDYAGVAVFYLARKIEEASPVTPPKPKPPRTNYLSFSSESEVRRHVDQNNDGICGIYEPVGGEGATLACVVSKGEYCLIYLSSPSSYRYKSFWQIGDIKASLQRSASSIMKANWFNGDKTTQLAYVTFDGAFMYVAYSSGGTSEYLKMYPTAGSEAIASGGWTGSGFALRDGYVVTNNHVVKGASSISVVGVNGSSTEMKARVVAVDSKNDLALIKINDSRFSGFGSIPYSVRNTVAEPGTDVFVLGYPMTQYMGEEIKLTNGIISSRSGYQGDITTYQISAPVQPGNSGGPMFDKDGNLIGIVNAGIPDAENVGYAIKTSYLFNLINSQVSSSIIPTNNTLMGKSLSDKVRSIRNYVFQIKCK